MIRRWTIYEGMDGIWRDQESLLEDGLSVEVMPVAEHETELQRVSEEYALQRAQLINALTTCRCPVGWGHVVAEDCPRHNPRPQHTISGVS